MKKHIPVNIKRKRRKEATMRILIGIGIGTLLGWIGGVW
mgnify:CR=1 FL=1|jgi:hypothetical protein